MEKDLKKKRYLYDSARFADLINGVICSGKRILSASDLADQDSQTGFYGAETGCGKKPVVKLKQQYRDLVKKAALGVSFVVIGIENQEEVHYLMPLRSMAYDTAEYERQAALIRRRVRKRRDITGAEFLSGFTKENRLNPCVTLILYYGEEWDGARDLHGILDFTDIPPELRDKVNNYSIYVCEVRKFENTEVFQTDIKQVFDCVRCAGDKEKMYDLIMNDPAYRELDEDTYDIIAQYTKTDELINRKQHKQEGEKVNMCKAIEEMIQDGRMEGMSLGFKRGIEQGIEQGIKAIIETCIEFGSTKEAAADRLMAKFQLEKDMVDNYMKQYWTVT